MTCSSGQLYNSSELIIIKTYFLTFDHAVGILNSKMENDQRDTHDDEEPLPGWKLLRKNHKLTLQVQYLLN